MMKRKFLLTMLTVLLMGQTVSAQSVFSPSVNGWRSNYQSRRAASPDAQDVRINIVVTCSIEASTADIANQMIELGAVIRVLMGNQLVVDIPLSQLDAAAAIEGVLLIDMPSEGRQRTDTARKASHIDEVHAGKMEGETSLPHAYTGKGVIIGLVDGGYDYTHPMFKDKDGNLRIIGVYQPWNMDKKHVDQDGNLKLENIPVVDEKGKSTTLNLTGAFYTKPDVILDTTIVKNLDGSHGTHCASIAAGKQMDYTSTFTSKYTNSGKLGGMAPEASLILTEIGRSKAQDEKLPGIDLNSYNNLQGLWAMRKYADMKGMPLVISLSMNDHEGFHDGTSTMARYVENYSKQQGNIMALCSSNEGNDDAHLNETIEKGKSARIFLEPNASSFKALFLIRSGEEINIDMEIVDLYETETFHVCNLNMSTAKTAYNYQRYFSCTVDENTYKTEYEEHEKIAKYLADNVINTGKITIDAQTGTGLDKNNKQFSYSMIIVDTEKIKLYKTSTKKDQYFRIVISSPNAPVKMQTWGEYVNLFLNGNKGRADFSVGDWNTSGEPITIGAYSTDANFLVIDDKTGKLEWYDESKNSPVGRYGKFSSYGYDYSDALLHTFPDVSAPGVNVYAAGNSFDHSKTMLWTPYENQFKGQKEARQYPYATKSGTSMATPAAAGIIALWMQAAMEKKKPLTNEYMKEVISKTSDKDDYTKKDPIRYGAGKINAYKGLLYILDLMTIIPELPIQHIGATLNGRTLHIKGHPDVRVTLYNLSGQQVLDTQAVGGIVELPTLPAGVYAVKIGTQGSTLIRL